MSVLQVSLQAFCAARPEVPRKARAEPFTDSSGAESPHRIGSNVPGHSLADVQLPEFLTELSGRKSEGPFQGSYSTSVRGVGKGGSTMLQHGCQFSFATKKLPIITQKPGDTSSLTGRKASCNQKEPSMVPLASGLLRLLELLQLEGSLEFFALPAQGH